MRNCKNKWQFTGTTVGLNRSADGLNSTPKNFSQMNRDLFSFVVSTTALISTCPSKRCNCVSAHTVTSLSMHRSGFNPRTAHMGFLVEQEAGGHVFLQVHCCAMSILFHQCCMLIHSCIMNAIAIGNHKIQQQTAAKLQYLHH